MSVPAPADVHPRRRPPRRRPVRLTRRGRIVVLAACLVFGGAAVVSVASASVAADPGGPAPVAVVRPGDTLWSVAARHAPSDDPYRIIEEIRQLNGLSGHTIHPGQQLLLPAGR